MGRITIFSLISICHFPYIFLLSVRFLNSLWERTRYKDRGSTVYVLCSLFNFRVTVSFFSLAEQRLIFPFLLPKDQKAMKAILLSFLLFLPEYSISSIVMAPCLVVFRRATSLLTPCEGDWTSPRVFRLVR